jgi:hypothetical protein
MGTAGPHEPMKNPRTFDVNAPPGAPESPYAPPMSGPVPRRPAWWLAAGWLALGGALAGAAGQPGTASLSVAAALCITVISFAVSLLQSGPGSGSGAGIGAEAVPAAPDTDARRAPRGWGWREFWIVLITALITGAIVTYALTGLGPR